MNIAGFHSGHECSYCVLEDGQIKIHAELERYIRQKEPFGDGLELLFKDRGADDIQYFTHSLCTWRGGIQNRHPNTYKDMYSYLSWNNGDFYAPGHHRGHAASAFFLSNLEESLIMTIDGGGREYLNEDVATVTFAIWHGKDTQITPLKMFTDDVFNIGAFWSSMTRDVFNLSVGYPKGHQAGTVMAMAALGDAKKYYDRIAKSRFIPWEYDYKYFVDEVNNSENPEQTKFDIAAGLQLATEDFIFDIIDRTIAHYPDKCTNLCLSGGVALNSVMVGKIAKKYNFKNIYIDPVPYDGGLPIGCALSVYHEILNQPRIYRDYNVMPYWGKLYNLEDVQTAIVAKLDLIDSKTAYNDDVIELLDQQKIIAVFGGGSESGRRALGNRSILADPRSKTMKDTINEKVKHRQWFRPFAPSILQEEVKNWFDKEVNSPYMSFVVNFLPEAKDKVPAVVHFDGSARVQTVGEKENRWYYNFLKQWYEKSGVPILLNTSFNDTEPIVETPTDAINCFLKTEIDYLYFFDYNILVERK